MTAPTGRSYVVEAPSRAHAVPLARAQAAGEGHPNARHARTLHVERICPCEAGLAVYEVVLEVGGAAVRQHPGTQPVMTEQERDEREEYRRDEREEQEHERHAALGENHWFTCPYCDDESEDEER